MSDNKKIKAIKSLYKISIQTRNFEINQLIQRNNFFMLFQGVLLASILQAENSRPFIESVICATGFFISYYQMQMASGAKFWQEWWESRVERFEKLLCKKIDGQEDDPKFQKLFTTKSSKVKKNVACNLSKGKQSFTDRLILSNYSVGRAPMKVSIVLLLTWAVLFLSTVDWSFAVELKNIDLLSGFPVYSIQPIK